MASDDRKVSIYGCYCYLVMKHQDTMDYCIDNEGKEVLNKPFFKNLSNPHLKENVKTYTDVFHMIEEYEGFYEYLMDEEGIYDWLEFFLDDLYQL